MIRKAILPAADDPAAWTPAIAIAIKCLKTGTATDAQQIRAFDWIVHAASAKNLQSYRADPYGTAFMEGRRFVGAQIMGMVEIDLEKVESHTKGKRT